MSGSQRIVIVRHGETEWSLGGQHTGLTDIPLTENGRREAARLAPFMRTLTFAAVFTSPLERARQTCALAGLGGCAQIDGDLQEWNYGEYEGLTPAEIDARAPGWLVFRDGCPGGESPDQVGARVDRFIAKVRAVNGDVALFAHGHVSRVFAARWMEFPILAGSRFVLDPATVSVLGYYRGIPAVRQWNAVVSAT